MFKKRDEAQRCQRLADLTEQLRLLQTDLANLEEQEDVQVGDRQTDRQMGGCQTDRRVPDRHVGARQRGGCQTDR